jgi:hypothetical protein
MESDKSLRHGLLHFKLRREAFQHSVSPPYEGRSSGRLLSLRWNFH